MAHIRHIALLSNDQERIATFYKDAFGLREVFRHNDQTKAGSPVAIYLTDGYVSLAIIPAGERPEGMYHFGFQLVDVDAGLQVALAAGATPPHRVLPRDGRQAETFITDPLGIKLDLSPGWSTS